MALFDWINNELLTLFGSVPTEEINFGILGTWSCTQIISTLFWLSVASCAIHFLVCLPYQGILSLMQVRKWRKRK
jgi:hypothetical protein